MCHRPKEQNGILAPNQFPKTIFKTTLMLRSTLVDHLAARSARHYIFIEYRLSVMCRTWVSVPSLIRHGLDWPQTRRARCQHQLSFLLDLFCITFFILFLLFHFYVCNYNNCMLWNFFQEIFYSDILFILEVILVVDFIDSRQHEDRCLSLTVYYCKV